MDPSIRLERHSELWRAGSLRVQRTAVSGLIFTAVIFFNVIEPYAQTNQSRMDLEGFEARQSQAEQEITRLGALANSLTDISQVLDRAAWRQHKEGLVQRLQSAGLSAAQKQQEADRTVLQIAAQVRDEVLDPLAAAIDQAGVPGSFAEQPARMKAIIDDWEQSHLGQPWFRTLQAKERTIVDLGTTLESLQDEASQVLADMQHRLDAERREAEQAHSSLVTKIRSVEEEIQKTLDETIPAWARGLVSVERMVSVFPWVLVGIAIYLVGSAVVAERHYHEMAIASGWSQPERSDPLLSSIWTLTWRGATGTALTLISYLAILTGLAYFLNRSIALAGAVHPPGWLPNLILLLALLTVIATPLGRR